MIDHDVQATFCATLVDEWVRAGVRHAVVCPGSRSTPMALALVHDGRLAVQVVVDERTAGFVALGIGMATRLPAVVLTTSGTAAVELHPAVVEAHQAQVPMLAVTADRPPELQGCGAPQTIDQQHLYGEGTVRWFIDPGVPDGIDPPMWRWVAARAAVAALGSPPGPVHVNLPFREPLVGRAGPVAPGMDDGKRLLAPAPVEVPDESEELVALADLLTSGDGVIIAGGGIDDPSSVLELASALGWPVIADQRSGCRSDHPCVVAHADALLRVPTVAAALSPALVLRLGAPLASKALSQWLAALTVPQIGVDAHGTLWDPEQVTVATIAVEPGALGELVRPLIGERGAGADSAWLRRWREADRVAALAIEAALAAEPEATEPATARDLLAALPDGATLVVSSSMPVRDLEWYAVPRSGVRVLANRGANGIDGITGTALGVALGAAAPTVALLGDLALLHDAGGLLGLAARHVDLVLVVIDNDGGGIFSFLPQALELPADEFEQLFGTPHGVDLAALAAVHAIACTTVEQRDALAPAVHAALAAGGVHLVVVRSARAANRAVHDALVTAASSALLDGPAPGA